MTTWEYRYFYGCTNESLRNTRQVQTATFYESGAIIMCTYIKVGSKYLSAHVYMPNRWS